jgi:hypothetical protein
MARIRVRVSKPLCIISAKNTTKDKSVSVFPNAETPRASPSARPCMTSPTVRGYAFSDLLVSPSGIRVDISEARMLPACPNPSWRSSSPRSTSKWTSGDLDELSEMGGSEGAWDVNCSIRSIATNFAQINWQNIKKRVHAHLSIRRRQFWKLEGQLGGGLIYFLFLCSIVSTV